MAKGLKKGQKTWSSSRKGSPNKTTIIGIDRALKESPKAWENLSKIASDTDNPAHFNALKLILAYAHGQPSQSTDVNLFSNGENGSLNIQITLIEPKKDGK